MSTDSELKEAAERLSEAVTACTIKLGGESATMDVEAANVRLKRVLAQRADDGDAVTFEEIESRLSDHDIFTVTQVRGVVMVFVESPFAIKTRGDLFRLLSALNVSTGGGAGLTRSKGD